MATKQPNKQTIITKGQRVPYVSWVAKSRSVLAEETQEGKLKAQEHRDKLRHRAHWSKMLMGIVVLLNVVSLFVVLAIGFGRMHYDNNALAVPAIIGANFAETWVLAKIALKFYFNIDNTK